MFSRDEKRYDLWFGTSAYSPGFRADNGFIVQNGIRRAGLWSGLRFYPKKFFSYLRSYSGTEYDRAFDGGATIRQGVYQGIEFQGKWGSSGWLSADHVRERVGSRLLTFDQIDFEVKAAPLRWLPAIQVDGEVGQKIDYAGARVGTGGRVNLSGTTRLTDHLEMQLRTSREWLDLDRGRLFNARIDWLKATYTFSPRSLVRAIAQQKTIERAGESDTGSLSLSGLYAYKLNWQTVFFVGYGDSSIAGEPGGLFDDRKSLFTKVAYAFQR